MIIKKKKTKNRKYSEIASIIKEYLEENILYDYDVTLEEEYRAGNGMRYDFCFPYLEEIVVIEADGVQHKEYSKFFHGNEQGFEESKARDFHKDFNTAFKNGYIIRIDDYKNRTHVRTKIINQLEEKLKDVMYLFEKGDVK